MPSNAGQQPEPEKPTDDIEPEWQLPVRLYWRLAAKVGLVAAALMGLILALIALMIRVLTP